VAVPGETLICLATLFHQTPCGRGDGGALRRARTMDESAQCAVEATDVVRVVLQFLKENGLTNSMLALQDESQVALNTVDNLDAFLSDVTSGHWESVMTTVATLKLPTGLLSDLYEQVQPAPRENLCSRHLRHPRPPTAACARAARDARAGHGAPDPAHRRADVGDEGAAA
jgi:hypothetical protein